MCGILGYTHVSRSLAAGVLDAGLRGLAHRGPDHQMGIATKHISLGATRLSIIDLAGGDQPMRSLDGNSTIVFNGEVFNHVQLRAELEEQGWRFRTRCDTEVVLNAFLEWGNESFDRFRGMFALAIWNERDKRLVMARDRMGIKPLYYQLQNGEISFGSELKCIFANSEVPRRIDLDALNCFLSLNYVPGPRTLVEGITKLMPGHMAVWEKGHLKLRSYLAPQAEAPVPGSLEEASEELGRLLEHSLSEQLVSEVPVGVWLSGGLDSSTVTHYAAKLSSRRLKTFSITFEGRSFDESGYIKQVSDHYGTDHTELDLNEGADLADVIGELSYYSDEPSADAGAVPVWYLSKLSRRDVTVALSGEGADELFGGYLTYKANQYRQLINCVPRWLRRAALGCARWLPVSDEKISFEYKLKRFLQGSLLSSEAAHVFWNGTFSEEEKRDLYHFADQRPLAGILDQMRRGSSLERYLRFDQSYSLPDGILYKVDRMSMAHAVEVRPPFLDSRIVEFAARLPEHFKISGSQTKLILRSLMKDKLPSPVLHRSKVGFDIPIHDWFRGILMPLLRDTLNESSVRGNGLFEWSAVERLMQQHLDRKANWGYHLWGLMTLNLWMKRWNVEGPTTRTPELDQQRVVFPEEPSLRLQPASYSAQTP